MDQDLLLFDQFNQDIFIKILKECKFSTLDDFQNYRLNSLNSNSSHLLFKIIPISR
jgi:hypothetical protein